MKKLALLLSLALLAACGGGGGGTTSSQGVSGQTSSLTVNIVEPAKRTSPIVTPATTNMRRIIITNPSVPALQGVKWTVPDYVKGSATPSFSLPVANGYLIEVLDYDITTTTFSNYSVGTRNILATSTTATPYTLVNNASANFNITSGANSVTITLAAVSNPSVTPPASITGSFDGTTTYSASATIPAGPFETAAWSLLGGYTTGSLGSLETVNGLISSAVSAPSPFYAGSQVANYYLAGKFYLKASLTKSGDSTNFTYTSTPSTVPLSMTSGNITIP